MSDNYYFLRQFLPQKSKPLEFQLDFDKKKSDKSTQYQMGLNSCQSIL